MIRNTLQLMSLFESFINFRTVRNDIDKVYKKNIDNFINDQFNCVRIDSIPANQKK